MTYNTHRIAIPGVTCIPLQLDAREFLKRVAFNIQPDIVIFTAGGLNVEWSEQNKRQAETVHVAGTANVVNVFDILQPKLIYLSSCYSFDGAKGNYHESDVALPSTALGRAKLGGENFVRSKSLNYVVVRSSPLLGRSNPLNPSFLDLLRIMLDRGKTVELSHYEYHSFSSIYGLTELFETIVESGIKNKVLHYSGLTKLTYYELGILFAERFGYDKKLILPKKDRSREGTSSENKIEDYSLNSTHISQTLKFKPLLVEECFDLIEQKLITAF